MIIVFDLRSAKSGKLPHLYKIFPVMDVYGGKVLKPIASVLLCTGHAAQCRVWSGWYVPSTMPVYIQPLSWLVDNCLLVWCLTARQHRIGQFVPTAGGWNRLRWLRMANETQCIILNTLHNVIQFTIKHSSYKRATTGYMTRRQCQLLSTK